MLLFSMADYSHPLVGGMLIGLSAVMLWWSIAKIAGISGIVASLWQPNSPDFAWQLAFFVGLLVSPWVVGGLFGLPTITVSSSPWLYVIAGLLVGVGTRMGSGCTSGHGICGNARFSPRSLLATIVFMSAGFLTVFIGRHGLALIK
ncbi:YeeE/YedE family protein [Moraxella osloensis]|nr:YeeE/YedE family protein [Moraxella osloensis]PAL17017.1 YeeE/YedE family protein [Moraxella osloensis]